MDGLAKTVKLPLGVHYLSAKKAERENKRGKIEEGLRLLFNLTILQR